MPTLRELKKRLKSTQTTCQLAGAMRTAATAKYSRLSGTSGRFSLYADALLSLPTNSSGQENSASARPVYVLLSGNRGLCGGYHHELFAFFSETLDSLEEAPEVFVCGKRALEYCREKNIEVTREFPVSDIPEYSEAEALCRGIYEAWKAGAERIVFVQQRFHNMLIQIPEAEVLLPGAGTDRGEYDEVIFLPDRETVEAELVPLALASTVYSRLLSAAAGVQAATMLAMRAAYDNASDSIALLDTSINRLRQAAVTASVIETSSENKEQKW